MKETSIDHLAPLRLRPNTALAPEVSVVKRKQPNSIERQSNITYSATDEEDEDFLSSETDEDLRI